MESEILSMTSYLFSDKELYGVCTQGGTDSIIHAILSYKNRGIKNGIDRPNIVLANTAHAAAYKAATMFEIEIRETMPDPKTHKFTAKEARKLIDKNTICIYASAPNYCHCIIDDIPSLG